MKKEAPHHLGHRKRLKERYEKAGMEGLQDYEILELLLFYAIPQGDVKARAKELLKRFGSLKGVLDVDLKALREVPGIGEHSSLFFRVVRDVRTLYLRQGAELKDQISSTKELIDYCLASMGGLKDEHFAVIYLNARNRIIQVETRPSSTLARFSRKPSSTRHRPSSSSTITPRGTCAPRTPISA
jgi:DNA repair protein RadC